MDKNLAENKLAVLAIIVSEEPAAEKPEEKTPRKRLTRFCTNSESSW